VDQKKSLPQTSSTTSQTEPVKITLAMIVSGDNPLLRRCIDNIKDYVDEIIVGARETFEMEGVSVYPQPKEAFVPLKLDDKDFFEQYGIETDLKEVFNFALARNEIFKKATGDWIIWLDDDDIIDKPELIRPLLEEVDPRVMGIEVNYAYHLDHKGRSLVDHWRTRIIRNGSDFRWKGGKCGYLHEDLLSPSHAPVAKTYDFEVLHLQDMKVRGGKRERNVVALLKEIKETTPNVDPRTLYYLGISLFDIGIDGRDILKEYIKVSGWDEQRYDAWEWIAKKSQGNEAVNAYLEAIKEKPEWPMAYFGIAETYLNQGKYQKALEFYQMGFAKPKPDLRLGINPRFLDVHQYRGAAEALLNVGKPKEAIRYLKKVLEWYPEDTEAIDYISLCREIDAQMNTERSLKNLAKYLETHNQQEKIAELLKAVPVELDDSPVAVGIRNKYFYKEHADNEITIYCPAQWEEWGPWSLTEGGIGGSEEAVIKLSNQLTKLGWKVTVYANPGERRGEYDEVLYLNADEINHQDHFNIFVAWRAPYVYDDEWTAKKKYLWLHDVQEPEDFTERRLSNLDKVIVLSKYHRSLFPIPEEKVFYSANGIDPFDYTSEKKIKRNPYKLIYTSCPSRGLEHLLDWWPEIRKEHPKAELHVFYGFHNFVKGYKDNPKMMAWKDEMEEKLKQEGITFHDRQPQDVIRDHSLESGIWAYPTEFPEISCITAMKMQSCGVWPATTGFAALEETQKYGIKQIARVSDCERSVIGNNTEEMAKAVAYSQKKALDRLKKDLIYCLEHGVDEDKRQEMMNWAREEFSWKKVAEQWTKELQDRISKESPKP
jgi:tetratricopeptide (TPR) repeat protein